MNWYLRLARRKPLPAVLLLFGGAAAVSLLASVVLGARGSLVPTLLYLAFGAALSGWLGLHLLRASLNTGFGNIAYVVLFVLALAICAFAAFVVLQAAVVAADFVLPFDQVDANVLSWQYHFAGRGPGSLHIRTDSGAEYEMPPFLFYGGARSAGTYRLELTHFGRLVIGATPLG